jgi:SUMO ligase MMS21 Smc5/6 complex component
MKYLHSNLVYWIIQANQPYLKLSLEKINATQQEIDYWCNHFDDKDNNNWKILLYHEYIEEDDTYKYSWNPISKYPDKNAKFMGEIIITEEEIANEKYNI